MTKIESAPYNCTCGLIQDIKDEEMRRIWAYAALRQRYDSLQRAFAVLSGLYLVTLAALAWAVWGRRMG